jgi:ribosome biogenesis protein YTM1
VFVWVGGCVDGERRSYQQKLIMSDAAPPDSSEPQVQVSFTTRLDASLRVTEAPIQLPTRLTRGGLSEVVNHLLHSTTPRPFDFLLHGQLLRGSLATNLTRHGLSGETVVVLEYIECIPPPTPEPASTHQDWVSALALCSSGPRLVLSGCYDHSAYLWDAEGKQVAALAGHTKPVKAVAWLAPSGGTLRAATASKDQMLRTWAIDLKDSGSSADVACEATLDGHTASVEAVVANPAGDRLCSGAWDGSMLLWSVSREAVASSATEPAAAAPPTKRSKKGGAPAPPPAALEPSARLSAHHDCVGALCWPTASLLYSGAADGTVREWKVDVGAPSATLAGQAAVACLDVSLSSALIASGHTDHALRVWDSRLDQAAMQLKLPHKGWVSAVRWCEHQPNLLASACYDGSVRLWDVRSTVPLHQLNAHVGKALCLAWDAEFVVSGGTDSQLRRSKVALP